MKNASFYRQEGRDVLKDNWGEAILACIIAALLPSALSFIPIIGTIACLLLEGLFIVGLLVYFIKLKNTRKSDINEIFTSMKTTTWTNIATFIIMGIFTALWSLLFIVPGIIKAYSYSMTMYLRVKKPELTATQTITLSREIMDGKKWKLFCLHCSFLGWMLLCLFTFGIGYFVLLPYVQASTLSFYEDAYTEHFGEEIINDDETKHSDIYNGPIEMVFANDQKNNEATDNTNENNIETGEEKTTSDNKINANNNDN